MPKKTVWKEYYYENCFGEKKLAYQCYNCNACFFQVDNFNYCPKCGKKIQIIQKVDVKPQGFEF
jgi:Zn finger protein HypA/HybF involved in hydrogenase expression